MMAALSTVALAVVAVVGLAIVGLTVRNYRRGRDGPRAARQASRKVFAAVVGAVLTLAVIASEALNALGALISASPDSVGHLVLGALALAGFSGWLEVGVVGATVLVVGVLVAVGVLRG